MDLKKRKNARLMNYDYSQAGAYFVTICTENRKRLFWRDNTVGAIINRPLSDIGQIAEAYIKNIPQIYNNISIPSYVVMPNHIHMIIMIEANEDGRLIIAPTISRIIKQYKTAVSKEIGVSVWQKGFFDHIIRNDEDLHRHVQYIDENPKKWENDEYY